MELKNEFLAQHYQDNEATTYVQIQDGNYANFFGSLVGYHDKYNVDLSALKDLLIEKKFAFASSKEGFDYIKRKIKSGEFQEGFPPYIFLFLDKDGYLLIGGIYIDSCESVQRYTINLHHREIWNAGYKIRVVIPITALESQV